MDVRSLLIAGAATVALAVGVTSGRALDRHPVPAVCGDPTAGRVEEDEVPWDHDGAALVAYGGDGGGCATYADGWWFDGHGWHGR